MVHSLACASQAGTCVRCTGTAIIRCGFYDGFSRSLFGGLDRSVTVLHCCCTSVAGPVRRVKPAHPVRGWLYLCCAPLLLTERCAEQVVDLVCSMLLISASFQGLARPLYSTPASLRSVVQRHHVQQAELQLVSQEQNTPGWQDLCCRCILAKGGFSIQMAAGPQQTRCTRSLCRVQLSVQLAAPLPAQIAQNLVVTDPEHAAHSQTNRQQHEQTA